jgi:hypothetical protein
MVKSCMLGLVCGSFLGLLVFAWNLLRVVVRGFFPVFWVRVSSVVWVLWGFRLDFWFMGALGVVSA